MFAILRMLSHFKKLSKLLSNCLTLTFSILRGLSMLSKSQFFKISTCMPRFCSDLNENLEGITFILICNTVFDALPQMDVVCNDHKMIILSLTRSRKNTKRYAKRTHYFGNQFSWILRKLETRKEARKYNRWLQFTESKQLTWKWRKCQSVYSKFRGWPLECDNSDSFW